MFRHFPVTSKHPRARALAHAAEAAALQGRFWEMHDSLLEDQAHLDDPHLWERARGLGLDLERFEARPALGAGGEAGGARLPSGIRAGVATTPTQFVDGVAHPGVPGAGLARASRSAKSARGCAASLAGPLLASGAFSTGGTNRMPPTGGG